MKQTLKEHNIELKDDFTIISNQSGGFLDYFHEFVLTVSPQDKKRLKHQIISANNYQEKKTFDLRMEKPRYSDKDTSFTLNYQDEWNYIYEYYKPNMQGRAPTFDRILISKTTNRLTYERLLD